MHGVNDQ